MEINSLGDQKCRPAFREALVEWGRAHRDELCEDCHNRSTAIRCACSTARSTRRSPSPRPTVSTICATPCRAHFGTVEELLTSAGVPFVVNPRMVRGLDYYTRTTFEVMASGLGAQSTVVAGGRYDGLVEALGGAAVAGIGFAIGVDRIALALEAAGTLRRCARRGDYCDGRGVRRVSASSWREICAARIFTRDAFAGAQDENVACARVENWRALRGDHRRQRIGARRRTVRDLKESTQREVAPAESWPRADRGRSQRVTVSCDFLGLGHRYSSTHGRISTLMA